MDVVDLIRNFQSSLPLVRKWIDDVLAGYKDHDIGKKIQILGDLPVAPFQAVQVRGIDQDNMGQGRVLMFPD